MRANTYKTTNEIRQSITLSYVFSLKQKYMTIASALKSYAQTEPHPPDAAMVMKTAEYLDACASLKEVS